MILALAVAVASCRVMEDDAEQYARKIEQRLLDTAQDH